MSKLTKVLSDKRKKTNSTQKSTLIDRLATRHVIKKDPDSMLFGDLFIRVGDEGIEDFTGKHEIINARTQIADELKDRDKSAVLKFDGLSSNINIPDDGTFIIGIDDFTIDWWEYKLAIPKPNYEDIDSTQYSLYKNSIDKKQPIKIRNTKYKSIYLSSDGDHWDIADDKYMGDVDEGKWVHWAVCRSNTNFYTFKNGEIKNIWSSDKGVNISQGLLTIGSGPSGNYFYGFINKFRFTKGQALWTEEFDPEYDLFY